MILIVTYAIYVSIALAVTIIVAQSLHRNGRTFLVDAFAGNERLADSVNHLLVVGFYLINGGYVLYVLTLRNKPETWAESIELLSAKLGGVLLMVGIVHLTNLYSLYRFRKSGLADGLLLPVKPNGFIEPPSQAS